MVSLQRHRGPDGDGVQDLGEVVLGHNRLAIIDLSDAGQQPMATADGSLWIVFNGEAYNFEELRSELVAKGYQFQGRSDTEVVLNLYREEGPAAIQRVRGMFACALWDANKRQLFLARDRFGKKPLVYARVGSRFYFASELNALVAALDRTPAPDRIAIDHFLAYGYIPSPMTAYEGVFKLRPGHTLTLHADGRMVEQPYWQLKFPADYASLTEEEAAEKTLAALEEAVRVRMVSDVPVGAFLSGGVDSGAVVAMMARNSSKPVRTFTVRFDEDKAFDESDLARQTAARYGTDHAEIMVSPDPTELFTILSRYGEPYADPSAIPSYYVAQAARQHVTVVLNGDGGDEAFAGYKRYIAYNLSERLPFPIPVRRAVGRLRGLVPEFAPGSLLSKVDKLLTAVGTAGPNGYRDVVSLFRPAVRHALWRDGLPAQVLGMADAFIPDLFKRPEAGQGTNRLLYTDVHSYLPDDLMVKMDIATMANSLEGRSPFLDHKLVEFCATLPLAFKLRGVTQTKYLLKKAMVPFLPAPVLTQLKKGFELPVDTWLRRDLRAEVERRLLGPTLGELGIKGELVKGLVAEHLTGKRSHGPQLLALLSLEDWFGSRYGDRLAVGVDR